MLWESLSLPSSSSASQSLGPMLGVGEIVAINFCFLQQMSGQGSAWKSSHYWNSSSDQPSSSKLKISTKWEETIAADCRRCHHVLHLKKTANQNQLNPYHHPQFPPSANVSCLKVITVSGNPFPIPWNSETDFDLHRNLVYKQKSQHGTIISHKLECNLF